MSKLDSPSAVYARALARYRRLPREAWAFRHADVYREVGL